MRFLIIIFLFLVQHAVFATLLPTDGYYITHDDDTIRGTIKVRIDYMDELYFERIQYGAFYEDSTGNQVYLKPDEIKSFSFHHGYQDFNFISIEYFPNYRIFLHAINEEGAIKLYVHYKNVVDTRTNFANLAFYLLQYPASSEVDMYYLVKEDGSFVKYGKYSGKKNISTFFSDYPALHSKISRGLYGYTSVYRMVREYNSWAREGKPLGN